MSAERRPLPPPTAVSADTVAAVEMEVAGAGLGFVAGLEPGRVGGGSDEVSICDLAWPERVVTASAGQPECVARATRYRMLNAWIAKFAYG